MANARPIDTPKDQVITVQAADLPLFCPGPHAPLWSMHPRVYLDLSKSGAAVCPYCGAHYQLAEGAVTHGR